MLISVQSLPEKNLLRRKSCRMSAVKAFLDSGYEVAEFAPEAGDTIRRAYNGLLMAVRRQYPGQIGVYWRGGKIYLKRLTAGWSASFRDSRESRGQAEGRGRPDGRRAWG